MQEALQRHAEGLKYRERNAGTQIDDQMKDEGMVIDHDGKKNHVHYTWMHDCMMHFILFVCEWLYSRQIILINNWLNYR